MKTNTANWEARSLRVMQQNVASCGRNVIRLWFEISPSQDRKYVSKLEFSIMNISQRGPHSCIASGRTSLRSKNSRCGNVKIKKRERPFSDTQQCTFYSLVFSFYTERFCSLLGRSRLSPACVSVMCTRTSDWNPKKCFFISVSELMCHEHLFSENAFFDFKNKCLYIITNVWMTRKSCIYTKNVYILVLCKFTKFALSSEETRFTALNYLNKNVTRSIKLYIVQHIQQLFKFVYVYQVNTVN